MDDTPTRTADVVFAVARALTNDELVKLLDVLFSRKAALEEKIAVLLAEANRESSPAIPPPT